MNDARTCPQCGRELPKDAPAGVCPQCLLGIGMRVRGDETLERSGPGGFVPPKPAQLAARFPQLEILDLIGQGGMGAVYKARQRGLNRLVALKILPPEAGQDPSFAARFSREAHALARLSHPHIVTVHDSGQAGGLYYLLMEYVEGVNLREAIQTGELTPREALAIVPQVCEALQYAHDEGVVHRDIKPENILLDKKGNVKIADFGLARLLGQMPENFTLTGTNQVMGTPRYMAPEQMEGSHEVDHRADIYSLGVVFYEMLTGELPLGRFDPPSKKVQVDVRLDEIVLRTLEKEPGRRYQAARDIKTDVETCGSMRTGHWAGSLGGAHGRAGAAYGYAVAGHGYEYRSKRELWGLPLVHIATGPNPATGERSVARGIIAIGDIALGLVAIGGFAVGGIAIGGAAVGGFALGGGAIGGLVLGGAALGLFTFGGFSFGMLLAIGGLAAGLGLSCGGFALGSIAGGGLAVGVYAHGNQAHGVHVINHGYSDPVAERFFSALTESLPFTVPLVAVFIVITSAVVGWGIFRRVALPRHAGRKEAVEKFDHGHQRGHGTGCVTVMLLVLLMLGAWMTSVSFQRARVASREVAAAIDAERAAEQASSAAEAMNRLNEMGMWDMTDAGPQLTPRGESEFQLAPNQVSDVNEVLQSTYRRYLETERKYKKQQVSEAGLLVTTIEAFPEAELAALEDDLWSRLDEILDLQQQKAMRSELSVHVGEGERRSSRMPGILGWGKHGMRLEIWKVGQWYHWRASVPSRQPTIIHEESAPELPIFFRRFWSPDLE